MRKKDKRLKEMKKRKKEKTRRLRRRRDEKRMEGGEKESRINHSIYAVDKFY